MIAGIAALTVLLAAAPPPARTLFGKARAPAALPPQSVGFYAKGCLAGAMRLPPNGPQWQAMRPSRNRAWGMPQLVAYIETLSREAHEKDGWPGLLVGDMSQPRGGPMLTGHASHQIGLDADIWLTPMPPRTLSAPERESLSAVSMIKAGTKFALDPGRWTESRFRLIRRAASYEAVERIFVNPGIKKALCDSAGDDRAWLRKVRPWYQHDTHFHVRLHCPPGMESCTAQDPTPAGDGCGADLAYWLGPEPYRPKPKPDKAAPPLTLADLPPQCADVLQAAAVE